MGIALSIVAIAGVVVSAYADLGLAERFVHDPESGELRRGREPAALSPAARRSLLWWIASVQAIALLPVIVAVSLLVEAVVRATSDELITPSTTELPLVARVVPALGPQLVIAVVVLVVVEALSSLATRRLMAHAWAAAARRPVARHPHGRRGSPCAAPDAWSGSPGRVLATALAGWAAIGLVVGFVTIVSLLAWGTAREVLIAGTVSSRPGRRFLVGAVLVSLFVARLAGWPGAHRVRLRPPFRPLDGGRATLTQPAGDGGPNGPEVLGPARTTPILDGRPGARRCYAAPSRAGGDRVSQEERVPDAPSLAGRLHRRRRAAAVARARAGREHPRPARRYRGAGRGSDR